ncbi:MAG TPA: hypothetical protein VNM92_05160 [Thermoanaerobaculia bacterium]|nr:hypothetical protein [Thermoanaerobaculia bacterium]
MTARALKQKAFWWFLFHLTVLAGALEAQVPLVSGPRPREIAVSEPRLRDAEFSQTGAAIGSNGDQFVAAWIDSRTYYFSKAIFATRIDENGKVLDPTGIRLSSYGDAGIESHPNVGSIDENFLVRWRGPWDRDMGVLVTPNGEHSSPRLLTTGFYLPAFAASKHAFLVGSDSATSPMVHLLDSDLQPLGPPISVQRAEAAGSNGRDFLLAHFRPGRLVTQVVTRSGAALPPRELSVASGSSGDFVSISSNGNDYLVVWQSPDGTRKSIHVTANGEVAGPTVLLQGPDYVPGALVPPRRPSVTWDGSDYVVAGSIRLSQQDGVWTTRVTSDGQIRSNMFTSRGVLPALARPAIASNGRRLQSVWQEGSPSQSNFPSILWNVRTSGSPQSLDAFKTPQPLTLAAPQQRNLRTALRGKDILTVWSEMDEPTGSVAVLAAVVSPNGARSEPVDITRRPRIEEDDFIVSAVGSDSRGWLVTWIDPQLRLHARHLDQMGRPDDEERVVASGVCSVSRRGIVWNGTNHLVAFTTCQTTSRLNSVQIIQLSSSGAPLSPAMRVHPDSEPGYSASVAWNGSRFYLTWLSAFTSCQVTCAAPRPEVKGIALDSSAVPLDASPTKLAVIGSNGPPVVASAHDGRFMVLWNGEGAIRAVMLKENGDLLNPAGPMLLLNGVIGEVDAVASGTGFAVGFERMSSPSQRELFVGKTAGLSPYELTDLRRIVTSLTSFPLFDFSLLRTPVGLPIVSYIRLAEEPEVGGVRRAFLQIPVEPRARSVRR